MSTVRPRAALMALSLLVLAALALPAGARAACPSVPLEQPFLRWFDPSRYTLMPGGAFEDAAERWALTDARVMYGNEPFYIHSTRDTRALVIAPGGSATSPMVCTTALEPVLRFIAKSTGPTSGGLKVEAVFEGRLSGSDYYVQVAILPPMPSWGPTPQIPVVANLRPAAPDEELPIGFRLSPLNGSTWYVDSVYLDPYLRS